MQAVPAPARAMSRRMSACVPRSFQRIRRVHVGSARSRPTSATLLGVTGSNVQRRRRERAVAAPAAGLLRIGQAVRGDYVRAARILGRLDVDVVLLQHEYGIFGGGEGRTCCRSPRSCRSRSSSRCTRFSRSRRAHQTEVLSAALRSGRAGDRDDRDRAAPARRERRVPRDKVRVVPHGAPPVLARRAEAQRALGRRQSLRGTYGAGGHRFLLSTFGLISPGKGLETVIEALPSIVERHPEVALRDRRAHTSGRCAAARGSSTD